MSAATDSPTGGGLDRSVLLNDDYVLVRMALVDDVGFEAAVLMQRIAWRCEIRSDGWKASQRQLAAETRLSLKKIEHATRTLRQRGYLAAWRADPWSSTLTWRPIFADSEQLIPKRQNGAPSDVGTACSTASERGPLPSTDDSENISNSGGRELVELEEMFHMPDDTRPLQ